MSIYKDSDQVYPAFGLEKIKLLIENTNRYLSQLSVDALSSLTYLSNITAKHEKEIDWAISGGIAQGIGGIGAGISAAADAQIKNMEIRQRNNRRDEEAANIRKAARQVSNNYVNMIPKLTVVDDALADCRVSVDEKTEDLFKYLRITVGQIYTFQNQVDITFSVDPSLGYYIDGYVKMLTYTSKGHLLGEDIIPIPVWQKGQSSAILDCGVIRWDPKSTSIKGRDIRLEFQPHILWKLTLDSTLEHYTKAFTVDDLESGMAKDSFIEYWRQVRERDARRQADQQKAKNKKMLIGLAAIVVVIAVVLGVVSYNQAEQEREAAVRLQESNAKFVASTIEAAEKGKSGSSYYASLALVKDLQSARKKVDSDSEEEKTITDLYLYFFIQLNDKNVANDIIEEYKSGRIDDSQVMSYAEMIRDFMPDIGLNEMIDSLPEIYRSLADKLPDAEKLASECEILEQEYRTAQTLFDEKLFADALRWFEKHLSYKYSYQYAELCKGVLFWCGTWQGDGDTVVIQESGKNVEYMPYKVYKTNIRYNIPYWVDLKITYNDTDITENKGITTSISNIEAHEYEMSSKTTLPGKYRFTEKSKRTCLFEYYNGAANNGKLQWQKYLTKTSMPSFSAGSE